MTAMIAKGVRSFRENLSEKADDRESNNRSYRHSLAMSGVA